MTDYHPSYAVRVRDLCFVGATDTEIARIVGVSLTTLQGWREKYPDFDSAWQDGRLQANAKVAAAMFKRACGYEYVKWKETEDGMLREQIHVPPDVKAGIFWLTRRSPELWPAETQKDQGSLTVGGEDFSTMSEIEIARRIAYALTKASHQLIEGQSNGNPTDESEAEQPDLRSGNA